MITGEKINLRVVRETDLDTLFALESDIARRGEFFPIDIPSEPRFRARFRETGFWSEDGGRLLIVDKQDRLTGVIMFFKPVSYFDCYEIAYILYETGARNKGYMSEALALMVGYLFDTKQVNRLQLTVIPGNHASRRVAEKAGFRSEGILRQVMFHRGNYVDFEMFSLLREEYVAAR